RQYMQYGYWKVMVIRKHRLPASIRHVIPALFVAGLGMLLLLGLFWRPGLWAAGALAGFYALAVLVASFVTASGTEWKLFPLLPVVFVCFQIGYGYGFLRGILDFMIFHNAPRVGFVRLTRKQRAHLG